MAGHNKWKQIKERKAKTDAARSRAFSKLAALITQEARAAKGDRNAPPLRAAIERARKENMPLNNIERAIKKATEVGARDLLRARYEAYGPGGAAIIIEALTENSNKTAQELKHLLSEHGGNLASPGAAAWAFSHHSAPTDSRGTPPQAGGDSSKWTATTMASLSDKDLAKLEVLVEALEAREDVQEVITNAE